jgi:hypothetical protein
MLKEFIMLSLFTQGLLEQMQKINARTDEESFRTTTLETYKRITEFNALFSKTSNFNTLRGLFFSRATQQDKNKALADVATLENMAKQEIPALLKKLKPDFKSDESVTKLLMSDKYSKYLNSYFSWRNSEDFKERYDAADKELMGIFETFEANLKQLATLKKTITDYKP